MDKIYIENLEVFAHHGVLAEETRNGQNFYVNAVLYTDTAKSAVNDNLELTVNYAEVCDFISSYMQNNTFRLIETVANRLAEKILTNFNLIEKIDIEIRKPNAPIQHNFDCVSVKITRGWNKTIVAVGSNMGESLEIIENATKQLKQNKNIKDFKASDIITTKPYGYTEQSDFQNGVYYFKTLFSPHQLLNFLHTLENNANRERIIHWGPRTLDLDIIFYENLICSDETLTIPHPDMQNRDFVLKPLVQIAPWYMHPVYNKTAEQLLKGLKKDD